MADKPESLIWTEIFAFLGDLHPCVTKMIILVFSVSLTLFMLM